MDHQNNPGIIPMYIYTYVYIYIYKYFYHIWNIAYMYISCLKEWWSLLDLPDNSSFQKASSSVDQLLLAPFDLEFASFWSDTTELIQALRHLETCPTMFDIYMCTPKYLYIYNIHISSRLCMKKIHRTWGVELSESPKYHIRNLNPNHEWLEQIKLFAPGWHKTSQWANMFEVG